MPLKHHNFTALRHQTEAKALLRPLAERLFEPIWAFQNSFSETVWKIRMNSTSGFQKSVKRGEKLSWCRKATPKSSIQTRPDFTKQFLEGLFPEIHTYVYSESAEEPNPEKPCPFLFSMSR